MGVWQGALALLTGCILAVDGFCLARQASDHVAPAIQHGVASWYTFEDGGQHTASGENFNPQALTAASRHLPFNTIVRVTNESNDRSVEVRINDRGPYVDGRILDLSPAAADSLDMKKTGTANVTIEVMEPASATATSVP